MRLVDITSFFSDSCGGIKTYYRNKARLLPARGVECHFVVPGKSRSEEAFESGMLHRIPGPRFPGNAHYRMFGDLGELARLLRGLRPDIIEVGSDYVLPALVHRAVSAPGAKRAAHGRLSAQRSWGSPSVSCEPWLLATPALRTVTSSVSNEQSTGEFFPNVEHRARARAPAAHGGRQPPGGRACFGVAGIPDCIRSGRQAAVQALERTRGRVGDMSLLLLGTPPYR